MKLHRKHRHSFDSGSLRRAASCASLAGAAAVLALAGCGNGTESTSSSLIVTGDAPLAYVKRSNAMSINPTDGTPSAPGGDLMVRESSSASANEHNLTRLFTQGNGDASDPEVSYDGKKIVFSMKCPTTNTSTFKNTGGADVPACTGKWNIWEYDMTVALTAGTFRRITSSTDHDDVDPAYLPAGQGFVFSSNRQTKSFPNQALSRQYFALDEYERERVLNLHTMNAAGANIQQISFNQSHDRNPVVRPNGDIMFARWEHVADRNRFAIFRVKPDGTDMFVLYGAQSPGNSFLHPRDMDPSGPFKGFLASSLMPLSRTQEGGALMIIDAANYPEHNTPANSTIPGSGGQVQGTQQALSTGRGLSTLGRITTPYPLWDGTDRVLLAWQPCQVTRNGVVVSCTSLTAAERALLNDENRLAVDQAKDAVQDNAPATYAIYMFDAVKQTWLIVAAPPTGFMYTDPVAIASRAEPASIAPTAVDAALAAQGLATIEVRSVYDTDGLNRMAEQMLVAADRVDCPAGAPGIALKAPSDPMDTRPMVADLARIKNPADPAYRCAPVRFVRATRAVAPPSSTMGLRSAIGDTEFEMQQILGYAPIEPDGSFKLNVPADTPLALAVIDSKGRAFQTHTNWIQVRPGERRTCDGCHSPRRGGALNDVTIANTLPAGLKPSMVASHASGETMAALRTRLDPGALQLQPDMVSADIWADTNVPGVSARPAISLRYTSVPPNPANDLATLAPVNGIVNYPDHIQPLWTRDRGPNTCTTSSCHDGLDRTDGRRVVDLRRVISGSGRLTSYQRLVEGDPDIDANGNPRVRIEDGVPVIQRLGALVNSSSGAANTAGIARKSRLTEVMFGENLFAPGSVRTYYPSPGSPSPNHATLLNAAEKRLLAEWMDLGGQYYNDPFTTGTSVRSVAALSQATFESQVFPILRSTCAAGCHQAIGTDPTIPTGQTFAQNRFVLTGSPEGDYNVTLSMISDTCNVASNSILSRPSTVPHPAGATTAVLPAGSAGYTAIATWITSGCVP